MKQPFERVINQMIPQNLDTVTGIQPSPQFFSAKKEKQKLVLPCLLNIPIGYKNMRKLETFQYPKNK